LKFEQEARNRKGENAKGLTADTEAWFAEQAEAHAKALQNPAQRHFFEQSLTRLRQSSMAQMAQYEDTQGRIALENSANASIATSISQAAQDAANGLIASRTPTEVKAEDVV